MSSRVSPSLRVCFTAAIAAAVGACNPASCLPTLTLPDAGLPSLHRSEDPIQEELVVQGIVNGRSAVGSSSSAEEGAKVRATVDRNDDGTIAGDEAVEVLTDGSGRYRLQVSVQRGDTVVVAYRAEGMAPQFRTLQAGPKANVRINVTLEALTLLECDGARCAAATAGLSVEGLAQGTGGYARVFNPVEETSAFPGDFGDSNGNLLISGVFSSVQLTDTAGNPIDDLGTPATLRMTVPKETWGVIKDEQTGNGRIDVPMYAFDEVRGTWVREGSGYLEDDLGATVPESALSSIRDGTFAGGIAARAVVSHFSYWNVDWPVDTKGCIGGIVFDRDGNPAEGATVVARGVSYTGSSRGITVGPDGRFCVEVMRSDAAGEDVDQDGITGETQRISLRVAHRGVIYDGGNFDVPAAAATCGGACLDVGEIRISRDSEIIPSTCAVSGTVKDLSGQPVAGASIFGMDPSMDAELWLAACMQEGSACELTTTSGSGGAFTIRIAMMDELLLYASLSETADGHDRTRMGLMTTSACPAGPIELVLDMGMDSYDLSVTVTGAEISWTPPLNASRLSVRDSSGADKWQVNASANGFAPPVTYGTVPAGATGSSVDGGPDPLASGDTVEVIASGSSDGGYPFAGNGSTTVP